MCQQPQRSWTRIWIPTSKRRAARRQRQRQPRVLMHPLSRQRLLVTRPQRSQPQLSDSIVSDFRSCNHTLDGQRDIEGPNRGTRQPGVEYFTKLRLFDAAGTTAQSLSRHPDGHTDGLKPQPTPAFTHPQTSSLTAHICSVPAHRRPAFFFFFPFCCCFCPFCC